MVLAREVFFFFLRRLTQTHLQVWLEEKGAQKTLVFLNECPLEDDRFYSLLGKHLKLLVNVVRSERFIAPLVELGLVEALLRLLDCPADTIRSSTLKLVGLVSVDAAARQQIVDANLIPEMMNVVTGKDETFLMSVLPRVLRDERLATCFCQYGGVAYLQKIMTMGVSAQGVQGAIVGISMLAQYPKLVKTMVDEEEFVASLIMMLTYKSEGFDATKFRVLILKAMYSFMSEPDGLKLVQESGPLPLMELIEHAEAEQVAAVVAAMEVLNVLCADKEMRAEVDRMGGPEFVTLLFFFAKSTNDAVLEPLCRLLRTLAQGDNRVQIVEGLKEAQGQRPEVAVFGATLTAITGGHSISLPTTIAASVEGALVEGAKSVPRARLTERATTIRQSSHRMKVIREVLTTERSYVSSLDKLVALFMTPLKSNAAARRGSVVTDAEITAIFGNVVPILELHRKLLDKLERLIKGNPSPTLSGWFSDLAERILDVYKPYFGDYARSLETLKNKMATKAFAKHVAKLAKDAKESLMLDSMLIMPIQRLPRLVLLLQEIDRATDPSHPEKPILGSVQTKLANKVAILNDVTSLVPGEESSAPQGRFSSIRASIAPQSARSTTVAGGHEFAQPVLREGTLREYLDDFPAPVLRKAILMRDKLVIVSMGPSPASPKAGRESRASTASGSLVHSFPLKSLRLDMLQDSFELVDLRDNTFSGPEFDLADPDEMYDWVNLILDAIFDAKWD